MDYRMNNIGSKIIANYDYSNLTKPIYPFFKPSVSARQYDPPSNYFSYPMAPPHPNLSPASYNNSYMYQARSKVYNSLLRDQIEDLEDVLKEKQTNRKEKTLSKVQSLAQLSIKERENEALRNKQESIESKQLSLLGDMVKAFQELRPQMNFPPHAVEYGHPTPKANPELKPAASKEEVLKGLDLDSSGEEEYLEKERKLRYSPNMTPKEKAEVVNRLEESRGKNNYEPPRRRIKGVRRFRALVWAILFPVFIYRVMIRRKGSMKNYYLEDMQESLKFFTKVAAGWVLKSTREPILSILTDQSLDFNITGKDVWYSKGKPDALHTKKLKLHVRIKGFFQGLLDATTQKSMPRPLLLFLHRFTKNGAFVPQSFFLPYEKARLEFDRFGALCNQNFDRMSMMLVFFLVTKILVSKFLLNPTKNRLPIQESSRVLMNLKVVASLVEVMALLKFVRVNREPKDAMVDEAEVVNRRKGMKLSVRTDDKISQDLITVNEMEVFYNEFQQELNVSKEIMNQWVDKLVALVNSSVTKLFS